LRFMIFFPGILIANIPLSSSITLKKKTPRNSTEGFLLVRTDGLLFLIFAV
jgi:hypothetical protein